MRGIFLAAATAVVASSGIAQSGAAQSNGRDGALTIDDSLFLPIRLPETMAFGYPPNEIFLPRIIELVRQRQFDSLDTMFDGLAADVRRDVRNELRFGTAFDSFFGYSIFGDPRLKPEHSVAFDAGIDGDRQDLSAGNGLPAIGQTNGHRNYCDGDGRKP